MATINDRMQWIDEVRGFAMLSVVICHISNGFYRAQMFENYSIILYGIQNICNSFQMPLFCIVSGFLFGKVYISSSNNVKTINRTKVKKQIINFLILYILWSIPFGIIKLFLGGAVNDTVKPIDLILIPFNPIGVYWWLYVLIIIYILISIVITRNINRNIFWITSFVLCVISSCIINYRWTQWFEVRRVFYYLFIFAVGIAYGKTNNKSNRYIAVIVFIIPVILIVLFWNNENEIYHIPIINLIVSVSLSLFFMQLFENTDFIRKGKLLQLIGRNSLEIYLLHVFITAGSRFIITRLPNEGAIFYLLVVLGLTLFIPIAFGFLLRKTNFYEYLFKPYNIILKSRVVTLSTDGRKND